MGASAGRAEDESYHPGSRVTAQSVDGELLADESWVDWDAYQGLLSTLWEPLSACLEQDVLKKEVEPALGKLVPGLHFARCNFGTAAPRLHGAVLVTGDSSQSCGDEVQLVLDVGFQPKGFDIALALGPIVVGLTDLMFRGRFCVRLVGIVPRLPVISGIKIFFANAPTIDFSVDGLDTVPFSVQQVKDRIQAIIASKLVYPQGFGVSIDKKEMPTWKIHAIRPLGSLKLAVGHLLGTRSIFREACGGRSGYSPSVFVLLRLGIKESRTQSYPLASNASKLVLREDCSFFIVDSLVDQDLQIFVYDQDTGSVFSTCDALLFEAKVSMVDLVRAFQLAAQPSVPVPLTNSKTGAPCDTIVHLTGSYSALKAVEKDTWERKRVVIAVVIDRVLDLSEAWEGYTFRVRVSVPRSKSGQRGSPRTVADATTTDGRPAWRLRRIHPGGILENPLQRLEDRLRLLKSKSSLGRILLSPTQVVELVGEDTCNQDEASDTIKSVLTSPQAYCLEVMVEQQVRLHLPNINCGLLIELIDQNDDVLGQVEWSSLSWLAKQKGLEDERINILDLHRPQEYLRGKKDDVSVARLSVKRMLLVEEPVTAADMSGPLALGRSKVSDASDLDMVHSESLGFGPPDEPSTSGAPLQEAVMGWLKTHGLATLFGDAKNAQDRHSSLPRTRSRPVRCENFHAFQALLESIWTPLRKTIEKDVLRGKVEPLLSSVLIGMHFRQCNLGDEPPRLFGVVCVKERERLEDGTKQCVELVLDIGFEPKESLNIELALGPFSAGVADFYFRGRLCIRLMDLVPRRPVVRGCRIFFSNMPALVFSLVGLAGMPFSPQQLREKVQAQIASHMVLPHSLDATFDVGGLSTWALRTVPPSGILRVRVSRVLDGKQVFAEASRRRRVIGAHGQPSISVLLRLGCLAQRTGNGTTEVLGWDEEFAFFVDYIEQQDLQVEVYDTNRDGLFSTCDVLIYNLKVNVADLLRCWARSQGSSAVCSLNLASDPASSKQPRCIDRFFPFCGSEGVAETRESETRGSEVSLAEVNVVLVGAYFPLSPEAPKAWHNEGAALLISIDRVLHLTKDFDGSILRVRATAFSEVGETLATATSEPRAAEMRADPHAPERGFASIAEKIKPRPGAEERVRMLQAAGYMDLSPFEVAWLLQSCTVPEALALLQEIKDDPENHRRDPVIFPEKPVVLIVQQQLRMLIKNPKKVGVRVELLNAGELVLGKVEWRSLEWLAGLPALADEVREYKLAAANGTAQTLGNMLIKRALRRELTAEEGRKVSLSIQKGRVSEAQTSHSSMRAA